MLYVRLGGDKAVSEGRWLNNPSHWQVMQCTDTMTLSTIKHCSEHQLKLSKEESD